MDFDDIDVSAFVAGNEKAIREEMSWLDVGKKEAPVKRCFRRRFIGH